MFFFRCSCAKQAKHPDPQETSHSKVNMDGKATAPYSGDSSKSLFYFDAMTEQEEENLAGSMYFDALDTLTDSMHMLYCPVPANASVTRKSYSLESLSSAQHLLKEKPSGESDLDLGRKALQKEQPVVPLQPGYPGNLTRQEYEAFLMFRKDIKRKRAQEPSYHQMVHCWVPVEEEAYAICRFMRARKFVISHALAMMEGNLDTWKQGHANNFFPNLETTLGCPPSVLCTQLTYFHHGIARNGSIVYYFRAGSVSLEALDCLTNLDNFIGYIWHQFVHAFKDSVAKAQSKHPYITIRSEQTVVVDLKGITRSLFTHDVMDVLKRCTMAFNCFPEILNQLVIMNAPFFFSAIWLVLKQFLDARTASKIAIYSNESKAMKHILEHVAKDELLSNFGGSGPSFDDVLQRFASEEGTGCTRQIVQRFFLQHSGIMQYEFDLTSTEKASVIVFTRSEKGALFTLSNFKETIRKVDIKRDDNNDILETETNKPYSAIITHDAKGPGHFEVSALSNNNIHKEYFLVQIRIDAI